MAWWGSSMDIYYVYILCAAIYRYRSDTQYTLYTRAPWRPSECATVTKRTKYGILHLRWMHFTIRIEESLTCCVRICVPVSMCTQSQTIFLDGVSSPSRMMWEKIQTFNVQMPVHRMPSTWNVQHFCCYLKKYQHIRILLPYFWFHTKIVCFSRDLVVCWVYIVQ